MKPVNYKSKVKIFSETNSYTLECEINKFLENICGAFKIHFSTCEQSFDALIQYIEEC